MGGSSESPGARERGQHATAQLAAANGWTELSPDQVAERMSNQVRDMLISQAVTGQKRLAELALEEAVSKAASSALEITIK